MATASEAKIGERTRMKDFDKQFKKGRPAMTVSKGFTDSIMDQLGEPRKARRFGFSSFFAHKPAMAAAVLFVVLAVGVMQSGLPYAARIRGNDQTARRDSETAQFTQPEEQVSLDDSVEVAQEPQGGDDGDTDSDAVVAAVSTLDDSFVSAPVPETKDEAKAEVAAIVADIDSDVRTLSADNDLELDEELLSDSALSITTPQISDGF